jgi:hypothetical protein
VGVDASDGGKGEEEAAVHPVMAWAQSEGGACGMMRAVHGQSKRPRGKGGGAPTEFDWFTGRETEAARGGREIGPRRCSAGGPVTGTIRRVCAVGVKKSFFWQKHSPNCDFLVLHSPSTLSTSKNILRVGPT